MLVSRVLQYVYYVSIIAYWRHNNATIHKNISDTQ